MDKETYDALAKVRIERAKELLEEADKMLYEEKKIKHATRNP